MIALPSTCFIVCLALQAQHQVNVNCGNLTIPNGYRPGTSTWMRIHMPSICAAKDMPDRYPDKTLLWTPHQHNFGNSLLGVLEDDMMVFGGLPDMNDWGDIRDGDFHLRVANRHGEIVADIDIPSVSHMAIADLAAAGYLVDVGISMVNVISRKEWASAWSWRGESENLQLAATIPSQPTVFAAAAEGPYVHLFDAIIGPESHSKMKVSGSSRWPQAWLYGLVTAPEPHRDHLVTLDDGGTCAMWDVVSRPDTPVWSSTDATLSSADWMYMTSVPDGTIAAVGKGRRNTVTMWDVRASAPTAFVPVKNTVDASRLLSQRSGHELIFCTPTAYQFIDTRMHNVVFTLHLHGKYSPPAVLSDGTLVAFDEEQHLYSFRP